VHEIEVCSTLVQCLLQTLIVKSQNWCNIWKVSKGNDIVVLDRISAF